ncbi:Coenzyme F420 hydrogenase/dehydrogenase, beta subunit C-terminal domain [Herbiconiux liukaitaii]|uniref:Coenzyme F420 hydrogenase/dehydrogenase, beta subunit C-terminal domain n=1 Tax=Herbiconiux liukaitaii TaxID=3342799 RepID=UPI0035BB6291
MAHDKRLGDYSTVVAARRSSEDDLLKSSSGGLTSFVIEKLLERGEIDGVIHSAPVSEKDVLFEFAVSTTAEELAGRKKSYYYATTFADALNSVRGDGRRYAILGVPCYIRAARSICEGDNELKSQLLFFAGLVCGHMKSQLFAESLAWQDGVAPDELAQVDFRLKVPGKDAGRYDFGARAVGAPDLRRKPTAEMVGGSWGHGAFQPEACNFCDDIFAETADVAFGDAWLPEYKEDWRGTNVVVSRNPIIDDIIETGREDGSLTVDQLSVEDAARTQAGNFRHRRDGLAVRLADDSAANLSVPKKRVAPDADRVDPQRRKLIRQRRKMSAASFELFLSAKSAGSLEIFTEGFEKLIREYRTIESGSAVDQAKKRGRAAIKKLLGRG